MSAGLSTHEMLMGCNIEVAAQLQSTSSSSRGALFMNSGVN